VYGSACERMMKEALKYAKVSIRRELVDIALREFVQHHKRRGVRSLPDLVQIQVDYDYKALRDRLK